MASCCRFCFKKYTLKTYLKRHELICEMSRQTEREKSIAREENSDLPSYSQLVHIIQELAFKNKQLEEKVDGMQKWVDKKKKKIDVIEWLNKNIVSTSVYETFVDGIEVSEKHIAYILEHNLMKTLLYLFETNIRVNEQMPFYCLSQKPNIVYVCTSLEPCTWKELNHDELAIILFKLNKKLFIEMQKWDEKHFEKINNSDKWGILFNKLVVKVNSLNLYDEPVVNKIRAGIFAFLKCDVKSIIEYNF